MTAQHVGMRRGPKAPSIIQQLWPIATVVFSAFFVIGLAMPVLPLHVHQRLGMSAFVVGLAAGGQFAASLISRLWAGRLTDTRGPKRAVMFGLIAAAAGGTCYLLSLRFIDHPSTSITIVLVGRALIGGAESLVITGGLLWGLGRVSPERSAQVIAWIGMSMFAALAIAAPIGSLVYDRFAFFGIALASILAPLATLVLVAPLKALAPVVGAKTPLSLVIGAVAMPGLGFALSGLTFGAVTTFLTLFFAVRGWTHGALAFSTFAAALIATRVVAGHLPDRLGGARVALACLGLQAAGVGMIGLGGSELIAVSGAAVTGAGFSLIFPSLGLEAVRRVPPASRGTAMGAYHASLDLALGVGSPGLGLLAASAGLASVFVASAIAALLAVPVTLLLISRRAPAVDRVAPAHELRVRDTTLPTANL